MRVDVSEVKCYRECKRKHQFNSRNRFHLRPITPNNNLVFGTQFHEVLHMMYLGTDFDKILAFITREVTDANAYRMMLTMVRGYYDGPFQADKNRYVVLDIEKSFTIKIPSDFADIDVCGSIDMICIDTWENKLVGFEHKSAKNFRPVIYNIVDEQPRVYSIALRRILEDYHDQGKYLEVTATGDIYLNQVRKLLTKFEYRRDVCSYSTTDLYNFWQSFVQTAKAIYTESVMPLPEPGFMKCQMCDYANLCMHYGYSDIDLGELAKEFEGEFQIRDVDHLDEKVERSADE